jgi:thiol-disulfide isomerase/thioredoxin
MLRARHVTGMVLLGVCCAIAAPVAGQQRSGDLVLLDFGAEWCGPCRSMEGAVAQLVAAGYPIRKINLDQNRDLARQFQVTSIPAFVLVRNGQELGRLEGVVSAAELQSLFAKARTNSAPAGAARDTSAASPGKYRPAGPGFGPASPGGSHPADPATTLAGGGAATSSAGSSSAGSSNAAATALAASVRLSIEDQTGFSYGSGTIVDARAGEALVLTCGHIFRDSKGQGKILVDVFGPRPQSRLVGRVVAYDLKTDVALVSIRPQGSVTAARIAPPGYVVRVGDRAVSVGCDNGANPSVRESHVTALNKFLGPANVEASGQPTQGRSGGGLFSADGYVIGVCNAADPADNEGLYAAATTIHAQLDQVGLSSLYRGGASGALAASSIAAPSALMPAHMPTSTLAALATDAARAVAAAPGVAATGDALRNLSPQERATLGVLAQKSQNAEVICIVRSLNDPQAKSEIIVIDRASPAFLHQLSSEQDVQAARRLTSFEVPRGRPTEQGGASAAANVSPAGPLANPPAGSQRTARPSAPNAPACSNPAAGVTSDAPGWRPNWR